MKLARLIRAERDGHLYWNIGGEVVCSIHAPFPGSDTWNWEDWKVIPLALIQGGDLTCEVCLFSPSLPL